MKIKENEIISYVHTCDELSLVPKVKNTALELSKKLSLKCYEAMQGYNKIVYVLAKSKQEAHKRYLEVNKYLIDKEYDILHPVTGNSRKQIIKDVFTLKYKLIRSLV